MDGGNKISDAGIYTDFSGLQKLRTQVSNQDNSVESREANKEVAKQFESLFLQMMLKSMRDASAIGESAESDQTKFYQEMFDKQIALDLANNEQGGLGIADMLEKDMGGSQQQNFDEQAATSNLELIRNQINRSSAAIHAQEGSK